MAKEELKPMEISLDAREPRDINYAFTMLCLYMDLKKPVEETKCVLNKTSRVDYNILLRFCERHDLVFNIDFKTMNLTILFTPVVIDITSDLKILEEENALKEIKANKEAEKIAKEKMKLEKAEKSSKHKAVAKLKYSHDVDEDELMKDLGMIESEPDDDNNSDDDPDFDDL